MRKYELELKSTLSDGQVAGNTVKELCQEQGFSEADVRAFELCTVEAFNNAAEHAHGSDPAKRLRIELEFGEGTLQVSIFDRGTPMDPSKLENEMPIPDPERPETWTERGRGLPIIRGLMNDVTYSVNESGNVFRFSKVVTSQSTSTPELAGQR